MNLEKITPRGVWNPNLGYLTLQKDFEDGAADNCPQNCGRLDFGARSAKVLEGTYQQAKQVHLW